MHNSMYLVFQHCLIQTMILIFRTRGSQFIGSFRLHYLSVSRQVPTCMSLIDYFYQSNYKVLWFIIAWKRKTYFRMMWNAIHIWLAGSGTTDWCCGGGSTVWESMYLGVITHGPVILAPYRSISQQIHYGWARQRFLPSFAYPRQTITWLRPLRRPTAWERIPSPPDGVIWNRSSDDPQV